MKHKGFTLVEFTVIISIFAIMASVALFNFKGFKSSVSLNNLSHDIALTIRQSQVFGGETLTAGTGGSIVLDSLDVNPVRAAHGVFFGKTGNDFDKSFILYKKSDPTALQSYENTVDATTDTITVQGPNRIDGIFSSPSKLDLVIDPVTRRPVGGTPIGSLSIAFSRPRQEPLMFDGIQPISDNYVAIYLAADADCQNGTCKDSHVIIISRSGQIEVQ